MTYPFSRKEGDDTQLTGLFSLVMDRESCLAERDR